MSTIILVSFIIISITIYLTFLYTCYLAVKLFRASYGNYWTAFLVIGLLWLGCNKNTDTTNAQNAANKQWYFYKDSTNTNRQYSADVILDSSSMATFHLRLLYYKLSLKETAIPSGAFFYTNGITTFSKWNPIDITIDTTDQKISYNVLTTVNTNYPIVGEHVSSKNFTGVVALK
ncbi:MAG: hypothetical protein QM726_09350 [Chitinophagaceae bacterium]